MPTVNVSLTTFVDFVTASGTARLTKLRESKRFYESGYAPERDYYKPLRDRIDRAISDGWSAKRLSEFIAEVADAKKQANYRACSQGLVKWVGRKNLEPFPAAPARWVSGDLAVGINPELWVKVNGSPHVIKLYLKSDPLSQQKANLILHLLNDRVGRHGTVAVLDARRGKLFTQTRRIEGIDALLTSEAIAFVSLWQSL